MLDSTGSDRIRFVNVLRASVMVAASLPIGCSQPSSNCPDEAVAALPGESVADGPVYQAQGPRKPPLRAIGH
ncbi:hypothetical protein GCM10025779_12460 [Arthrobacter cryoconiti]